MNSLYSTALCILLLWGGPIVEAKESNNFSSEWLATQIRNLEPVPSVGTAVAIIKGNDTLISKGFGWSDREKKIAVTTKTLFQVGSTTKAMASYLVKVLEQEGKVSLDSPINLETKILEFKDKIVEQKITLRDILSHQSGLPANDILWVLSSLKPDEWFQRLKFFDHRPNGFRNSFIYNNFLYASVGKIIQEKTGENWTDLFSSKVLSPLGMSSSGFNFSQFRTDSVRARPYFEALEIPLFDTDRLGLAGGLVSNLEDMTKWLRFNLSRTNLETRVDQYDCLNVLRQPEGFVPMGQGWFGKKMCYGLGWFSGTILGSKKVIFHGGNIDGYSSLVLFVPEDEVGLVILTNQSVSPYPGRLAQKIVSQLYGAELKDSFEIPTTGSMPEPEVPAEIPETADLGGEYFNPAYGNIFVESKGKKLLVKYEDHIWTGSFKQARTYSILMEIFGGMKIPMNLKFVEDGLEVPFNLDPETPAVKFLKKSH